MSLFIDTDASMLPELSRYESSISEVAKTESIDLTGKIEVAKAEIGCELEKFITSLAGSDAQTMWRESSIAKLTTANVVVTPALWQWHIYQTLAATYRDAYHSQLNTRYQAHFTEFAKLASQAQATCLDTGLGIVWNPVRAAGVPLVRTSSGAMSGGGWFLRVAWTGMGDIEGAPGPMAQYPAPAGESMTIQATNPPVNVTGWNLYAGQIETSLGLQNDVPVAPGSLWILLPSGFRVGRPPGTGQKPDELLRRKRILRRG